MKPHNENRRKYPRADLEVDVKLRAGREQKEIQVRTRNISAGGVCVMLAEMLPVGTQLRMVLELPDTGSALDAVGEVVWSLRQHKLLKRKTDVFETGIKFVDLDNRDRDRLIRIAQNYLF